MLRRRGRPRGRGRGGLLGRGQHVLLADASADAGAGDRPEVDALLAGQPSNERSDVAAAPVTSGRRRRGVLRTHGRRGRRRGRGGLRRHAAARAVVAAGLLRRGAGLLGCGLGRCGGFLLGGLLLRGLLLRGLLLGRLLLGRPACCCGGLPRRHPPPMTASFAPTSTVSSSETRILVRTPAAGEGISVSTLSVETSRRGSSTSTCSPSCLSQRVTVPSVTLSPSAGMVTGVPSPPPPPPPRRLRSRSPPRRVRAPPAERPAPPAAARGWRPRPAGRAVCGVSASSADPVSPGAARRRRPHR